MNSNLNNNNNSIKGRVRNGKNNSSNNNKLFDLKPNKKYLVLLAVIFTTILVIFGIIIIYLTYKTKPTKHIEDHTEQLLQKYIHDCKNNPKILPITLSSVSGNEYSISFWLYVNSLDKTYQSQDYKREIITIGPNDRGKIDTNKPYDLNVSLSDTENKLNVDFGTLTESNLDIGCINLNDYIEDHIKDFYNNTKNYKADHYTDSIIIPDGFDHLKEIYYVLHEKCSISMKLEFKNSLPTSSPEILKITALDEPPTNILTINYDTSNNNLNFIGSAASTALEKIDAIGIYDIQLDFDFTETENKLKITINDKLQLEVTLNTPPKLIKYFMKTKITLTTEIGTLQDSPRNILINEFIYKNTMDTSKSSYELTDINDVTRQYYSFNCFEDEAFSKNKDFIASFGGFEDEETKKIFSICKPFNESDDEIIRYKSFCERTKNCSEKENCVGNNLEENKFNLGSDNHMYVSSTKTTKNIKKCEYSNLPMQRWCMVTLNIHNNICDLFFDGKLYRTCVFTKQINNNINQIIMLGNKGGFDGYVSNVIYSNKSLRAGRVENIYLRGPRFQLSLWERIKYLFTKKPKFIKRQTDLEENKLQDEKINEGRVINYNF